MFTYSCSVERPVVNGCVYRLSSILILIVDLLSQCLTIGLLSWSFVCSVISCRPVQRNEGWIRKGGRQPVTHSKDTCVNAYMHVLKAEVYSLVQL